MEYKAFAIRFEVMDRTCDSIEDAIEAAVALCVKAGYEVVSHSMSPTGCTTDICIASVLGRKAKEDDPAFRAALSRIARNALDIALDPYGKAKG